jgi:hypothetical protein
VTPPFRADHVGSLLRLPDLKEAREDRPQQARNRPMTFASTRRPNRPPALSSGACRAAHRYSALARG